MSKNDITGDRLVSKVPSAEFRDNFDAVFGRKSVTLEEAIIKVKAPCQDPTGVIKKPRTGCQGGKCKHASDCVVHDSESDAGVPKPPPGYTAEELERDNPYNQWMYEK